MEEYTSISDFCASHDISHTFLYELHENGLIQIIRRQEHIYLTLEELPKAEKMLRLHTDLNINMEGVEVIARLLDRLEEMQAKIDRLQHRLYRYE
jgi:chaperone modulatory protein CbpM